MKFFRPFLVVAALAASASFASAQNWYPSYQELLKKYAREKGVKYAEWKASAADMAALNVITKEIGETVVDGPSDQQKAFYINAYNVWVLQKTLSVWPVKSINPGGYSAFFDKKDVRINKRDMSLNELEKGILLKRFPDPRIHFSINCASKSCPPLPPIVITAENMNDVLDALAKKFINSPQGVRFERNRITASRIFSWYEEDFKKGNGNLLNYLNKYRTEKLPQRKIDFDEYDWGVNVVE